MRHSLFVKSIITPTILTLSLVAMIFLPFEFININAQKTNSSSIKEIIDKVVSDTLDGMMNDTLNSLIKNATNSVLMDQTDSPHNKFPSSLDISHIAVKLPYDQLIQTNATSAKLEKNNIEMNNNSKLAPLTYPNLSTNNRILTELHNPINMNGGMPLAKNLSSGLLSQSTPEHNNKSANFFSDIIQKLKQFFFMVN
jgi:hypothetical protein